MTKNRKQSIKLVVTDADGTYQQFWYYFVPAMRKFVPEMAHKLGISMDDVSKELGRVMMEQKTHEYPWTLELTRFRKEWKGSPAEFRQEFVVPFWAYMDKYRIKYLRLLDDVLETFVELKRRRIPVAILSDAPYYMAVSRATQVGVDGLIDAMYALESAPPPTNLVLDPEDLKYGMDRVRQFEATRTKFALSRKLPVDFEKPNPRGLAQVMEDFNVKPSEVLFIGDSLVKDGGVAQAHGVKYVWARYGVTLPEDYRELIDVHFNPNAVPQASGHGVSFRPKTFPPMVAAAASYAELLKHLGPEPRSTKRTVLPLSATTSVSKTGCGH